jgi:hypothetical protein
MAKRKAAAPARTPARSKKKIAASPRATPRNSGSRAPVKAGKARRASAPKEVKPTRKKTAAQRQFAATVKKKKKAAVTKKASAAKKVQPEKKAAARRTVNAPKSLQSAKPAPPTPAPRRRKAAPARANVARLNRARRTLDEPDSAAEELIPSPPSSLDLDSHASAASTGRLELAEARRNLRSLGDLTMGDVDADAQNAYFSGDEAPGGDNPTPDQDIVDDIGKAIGVQYQDNEELQASEKVVERDRHRWELDPASSEDYKERK